MLSFMRAVMTPPAVSITREEGQHQEEDLESSPQERMAVWTAEPYATTSSELMLLLSTLPWKKSETSAKNKTGTTDQDDFMEIRLSVLESWRTSRQATEKILAEVFETGAN